MPRRVETRLKFTDSRLRRVGLTGWRFRGSAGFGISALAGLVTRACRRFDARDGLWRGGGSSSDAMYRDRNVSSATGAATYIPSSETTSSSAAIASGADAKERRTSIWSARSSHVRSGGESGCSSPSAERSRASFSRSGIRCGYSSARERPPEDQRQRHEPHAGHVGAMIEARQPGARRHRDAELLPEPIAAELQLLDRGAEHVLDDHEPRVRGDDQPLGRDQAVRDVARVLVQHGDRRHELADQAQRGVDVELQLLLLRDAQDVGEPRAFEMIRHDRQRGRRRHRAIDAAHARVVGVAEIRQPRGALAQREFE